jgi:hypothetical protein
LRGLVIARLRVATATLQDVGTTEQHQRVDSQSPGDQGNHNDGADSHAAGGKAHPTAAKTAATCKTATAAIVLDVIAATKIFPAHENLHTYAAQNTAD